MTSKAKAFVLFILPIIFVAFLVLWPSFNLHLTGDDYLGLWRYNYYLSGRTTIPHDWMGINTNWNNINYFLTDYGPQDTFTAIIHHFFGFQPQYYYFFSFILRVLAACSFFPLIYLLTKNKIAAYCTSLFFAITTAGLQTTDWSFNMPSYLAISIMNMFFLTYIKSKQTKQKHSARLFILSLFILYFAVIAQPIRMTFLPLCATVIELFFFIRNKITIKSFFISLLKITLFIGVLLFIYFTGFIGDSVGAGETFYYRTHIGWQVLTSNLSYLHPYFSQGQFQILAYPVAMFGSLIFPTNIIPSTYEILTPSKAIIKLLMPLFLLFALLAIAFWKKKRVRHIPYAVFSITIGLTWSVFVYLTFETILVKSQFTTMLLGGYVIILLFSIFVKRFRDKTIAIGMLIGILITFLSFMPAWVRTPTFMYDSAGRYLILPASGFSILLGTLLGSVRSYNNKRIIAILFVALFAIQAFTTFTYIYHLSTVRSIQMTESIRKSIPYEKDFNDLNKPIVYYFQPSSSEILHHSLLFGLPVIMGFQYNFYNIWHFVYTDNWQEVVDAYQNGSSLKRFSIPVKKVPLTDIYSFQLDGDHLTNTTLQTRDQLKALK